MGHKHRYVQRAVHRIAEGMEGHDGHRTCFRPFHLGDVGHGVEAGVTAADRSAGEPLWDQEEERLGPQVGLARSSRHLASRNRNGVVEKDVTTAMAVRRSENPPQKFVLEKLRDWVGLVGHAVLRTENACNSG